MRSSINGLLARASARGARLTRVILTAALAGMSTVACDVHGPTDPGSLSSIVVAPNTLTVGVNGTQQFTAVGRDFSGINVGITPTWTVESGGGTISSTGMFTAGTTPGGFGATIKATSGGLSGTAQIIVVAGPLATIVVTPNPISMAVGITQQFIAVGRDASGNIVQFTPTWSTVGGGGTVSGSGVFTAGTVTGAFPNTVQASNQGIKGTAAVVVTSGPLATVTVTPTPVSVQVNGTQQFVAVGGDGSGNQFLITPVWAVVSGGGSIDASTGIFTAGILPGTFTNTIRATSGTLAGFATVTVTAVPPALATITVTPNPGSLLPNTTQQFGAVGRDGNGNIFPISPVWSVVNGGGSIDSSTGLFTAGAVSGTFANTVRAVSGTMSGTATVIVTVPVVPPPPPPGAFEYISFGAATPAGILAATAVTCSTAGLVVPDISVWPGSGFTPGTCVFNGTRTLGVAPANTQQSDFTTAYNTLAGLICPAANIIGDIGGTTLLAATAVNVYCTAGGNLGVTGTVILDGNGIANAVFVLQSPASSMTTAGNVVLQNGALAKNVYWVIGTQATLGVSSHIQGNVLANTSVVLVDAATLVGRAFARTGAVTLGANNVIVLP